MKKFTLTDGIIVSFFFLLSLTAMGYLFFFGSGGKKILLIQAGLDHYYYSLDQTRVIEVAGEQGLTAIEIAQGKFRFVESPCLNQLCLNQGWISMERVPVICLPNKVSAYITSGPSGSDEYDGVSY